MSPSINKAAKIVRNLAVIAGSILIGWILSHVFAAEQPFISLLSPDGSHRAVFIEPRRWLDRNFVVRVIASDGTTKLDFRSPDEGMPPGTERFVWSDDNRFLMLVGRHFYSSGDLKLTSGETVYLLYDVSENKLRCNSLQTQLARIDAQTLDWKKFGVVILEK